MNRKNNCRLYPFFHMFFEIIFSQHSICMRSCCIKTLVFLFFLEGGIVRDVGGSGRGSCKIDKSVGNQCLMQTNAYHMHLMMLEMWAPLGESNIHQPSSMLYVTSQAMTSGKISQILQELCFHSFSLCSTSSHCSVLSHATSFLSEYIL